MAQAPRRQGLTTDAREQFETLVAELDAVGNDLPALLAVQMKAEDELLAALLKHNPKTKIKLPPRPASLTEVKTPLSDVDAETLRICSERWHALVERAQKVLGENVAKEIYDRFSTRVEKVREERDALREKIKEQLGSLASELAPRPGPVWTKVDEISELVYRTQTSPLAYAQTSAELRALDFIEAGLDAEVRSRPRTREIEHPRVNRVAAFEVWVQADALDVDIVKFGGHGLDTAGWLQQIASRAMNPRVFVPGLPWGLEEKLGIVHGAEGARHLRAVRVLVAS